MGMLQEFRNFAMRGNMVDMAVGIIIGGAFQKIVSSLVQNIVMPPLGQLLGKLNFNELFFTVGKADLEKIGSLADARKFGVAVVAYGEFISQIIDFVIMAFCVFMMVKAMNRVTTMLTKPVPNDPKTKECPHCCSTIPIKATRCGHCTSELAAK